MRFLLIFIRTYWLACTAVILAAITALSLWTPETLPPVPGGDKIHHLIAYALLIFPVALRRPKGWQFIVVMFIGYSGLIELIQPFVNRYGEWLDLAANTTGLFCGVLIAEAMRQWEIVKD
ncbi:VanZ-like domain-containing protein [Candidatus Electrothrix laxa]